MVTAPRRVVWAWTVPAAFLGWVVTGALVPLTISACADQVIESGIIRRAVWVNSLVGLTFWSLIALVWVVAYFFWASRRQHSWILDTLVCIGFGATAWAVPWVMFDFTIGDHWESRRVEDFMTIDAYLCGLDRHPLAVALILAGLFAMTYWICWLVFDKRKQGKSVEPPKPEPGALPLHSER